jgi:glycosyltransferase involved in cell wall biosynthesis
MDPPPRWLIILVILVGIWFGLVSKQTKNTAEIQNEVFEKTCAVVMVKNEADVIERLLSSIAEQRIAKHVFLCDTGSTDDTIAIAKRVKGDVLQLRVSTKHVSFVNFEQARNKCNTLARKYLSEELPRVEWIVFADADLVGKRRHFQTPTADVNVIQRHAGVAGHAHNSMHMLVSRRAFFKCEYRLWTHEYLECASPGGGAPSSTYKNLTYASYDGFYYIDYADGSNRANKLERDARLLEQWLVEKNETDLRGRALYYLARTYEDQNKLDEALATYKLHDKEQTFTNYLFYSAYRVGLVYLKQNKTKYAESAFLRAHATNDGYFRREPLYYLARLARFKSNLNACIMYGTAGIYAPPVDHARVPLFLEMNVYEWVLHEELAYCYVLKGKPELAAQLYRSILDKPTLLLDKASHVRIQTALEVVNR